LQRLRKESVRYGYVFSARGTRKNAVANAQLFLNGTGEILVNNQSIHDYFINVRCLMDIAEVFEATQTFGKFNISVALEEGGGQFGQAAAIKLAIARCLAAVDDVYFFTLKDCKDKAIY
jgi:ribosomal protein S9